MVYWNCGGKNGAAGARGRRSDMPGPPAPRVRAAEEADMDAMQFFSFLRQFNADTVLIGAAVWGLEILLVKTILDRAPAKVKAVLPFALGAVLCAAYSAATGAFAAQGVAETLAQAAAQGVACGALATVGNVVLAQFGRGKAGDGKTECVKAMLQEFRELTDEEAAALVTAAETDEEEAKRLLNEYAGEAGQLLYPLLVQTLAYL